MSVQAMAWALEQEIVEDASARHVLLCLANYADHAGKAAFPSTATLVKHTRLSERTVRAKLDVLESVGAIQKGKQAVVNAYIDRGDRRPVSYDLMMDARGVIFAPREDGRGANYDSTGCNSCSDGVQIATARGAAVAPNPSLTILKPSINRSCASDEKFDEAWRLYPKREGGSVKKTALKAWNGRIREGIDPDVLIAAVKAYAKAVERAGNIGTRFVKQASTFFGPDGHFEEYAPRTAPQADAALEGEMSTSWWERAGFVSQWDAVNAGCTEKNAGLWRDGRPTRRIAGANVDPWPQEAA